MPRVVDSDIGPIWVMVLEDDNGNTVDLNAVREALTGMSIFVNGYRVVLHVGEVQPDLEWLEDKFPADERNNEPLSE